LKSNVNRKKENIDQNFAITVDIDSITMEEIGTLQERLDPFNYVIHTTFSHTAAVPRIRLIVPLDQPVSPDVYEKKKLASCLAQWLGIGKIDDVSDRPAQVYFLPSHPPGITDYAIDVHRGTKTLSLADLPKKTALSKAVASSDKDADDHDATVAEAMRVVKDEFGGSVLFVAERFHAYADGIWQQFETPEFVQKIMMEVYKNKQPLATVQSVINMMKVLNYQKRFPICAVTDEVIVLQNCSVAPMTGKVLPHAPEHFARNRLTFNFDEKAICPLWMEFLSQVWKDDPDVDAKICLLQEFTGYSLIRSVKFQKMIWLIGAGANGKSVILDVLRELVGPANVAAVPFSKFGQRFALAQLFGRLVNISPEISSTAVLADSELKSVVVGDVTMLERKMEHPFEAKLETKLWAAANFLPKTKDHSHGFFRRIFLLTFNRTFLPEEQDKDMLQKLKQELPGIFNWALEGLHRLLENDGFTEPPSSLKALEEYKTESNSVALFKQDHLNVIDASASPSAGTRSFDVYSSYARYCRANGYGAVSNAEFGKRLISLGIKARKSNGSSFYPVRLINTGMYADPQSNAAFSTPVMDVDDMVLEDVDALFIPD
jgi:putative DNA primase/helicase